MKRLAAIILLCFASHVLAGPVTYSAYHDGTLELRFSLSRAVTSADINGLTQYNIYPVFTIYPTQWGRPIPGNVASYEGPIAGIYMVAPDTVFDFQFTSATIPTTSGTYDLVPEYGVPREAAGSDVRSHLYGIDNPFTSDTLIPLDTLVISTDSIGESHNPEPASIALVVTGLILLFPLFCRSRCRQMAQSL